jgi:hypothetical protein
MTSTLLLRLPPPIVMATSYKIEGDDLVHLFAVFVLFMALEDQEIGLKYLSARRLILWRANTPLNRGRTVSNVAEK